MNRGCQSKGSQYRVAGAGALSIMLISAPFGCGSSRCADERMYAMRGTAMPCWKPAW